MSESQQASCSVEIINPQGLHLRAASRFVEIARKFQSAIAVCREEIRADGKSIWDLIPLQGLPGTILLIQADGPDARAAVAALAELVNAGFYELEKSPGPSPDRGPMPQ